MNSERIFVVGTGIVNPLGQDAITVARFLSAGISAVQETEALNKRLRAIKMARVPEQILAALNPQLASMALPSRQERMLRLAGPALKQLASLVQQHMPLPIVLALPEQIAHLSNQWKGNVVEQLALQSGIELDMQSSLVAEIGRSGGLRAVKHVFDLMEAGHDLVLLGGVDTYWDAELLARLDEEDRLLVQSSTDGFQPGEGSCFVLLASEKLLSQLPPPHIAIYRPGNSEENGHRYSDSPYRGDGLANAVRDAIEFAPVAIDRVWTSMIYDSFCNKEFGVAVTRNSRHFSPHVKFLHHADCFGDLGAAVATTLIAVIVAMSKYDQNFPRHHLLCCSSDTSYRSALRLDIF